LKIILHGSLRDYPEMEIHADTVAEAIEGWSRQTNMGFLRYDERPVIEVLGFDTVESLYEKTDVEEIHLVPAMYGGGGGFGKILLGAALIGAGLLTMGMSVPLGTALIGAGIGTAIGGVMQLFLRAPTLSQSNDPDPSKYLSSGENTTAIGTLISKGYGRMIIGGHYMSVQVNSSDMVMGSFPSSVPA